MSKKLDSLRSLMVREGMDAYIIPTADFHESEYVGDYFKARSYVTGFTGSAGVAVATMESAGLWTDGRYFIQAAAQLADSGFDLMKMGEPGVPTIEEYLKEKLPDGGKIGCDGRVLYTGMVKKLQKALEDQHVVFAVDQDLVNEMWTDRPALSCEPAFRLKLEEAGVSAQDKVASLREDMKKEGASVMLLPGLDDIAWLLNIRGNDIDHNPYLLSFAAVEMDKVTLFAQSAALSDEVKSSLEQDGVSIAPYETFYDHIAQLKAQDCVWIDTNKLNYAAYAKIPTGVRVVDKPSPITLKKAIKNATEVENTRRAHIKDGVAFTRFLYWLKNKIGKEELDEITASDYLGARRAEQEGFLELSFETISAYNANAAMMHYSAKPGSAAKLEPRGFLLVDSGGTYLDGTTDITRTIALGDCPEEWKVHYTATLRGMINLSRANFLYGCRGVNLDILARGPLWDMGIDYKCGTGHGVAHIGGVHEPPNGFRWRIVPERNDSCVLEEGMITTNEPGVYVEGSHGIRIENELLCVKGEANEYGQFMHFDVLTFAPIDLAPVIPEMLTAAERKYLNDYHAAVYEKLSPYLTQEEQQWLKHETRAI